MKTINSRNEVQRRIDLIKTKTELLVIAAQRLPDEVSDGSIEYDEANDSYLPTLNYIVREIDELASRITAWNPTANEKAVKDLEQEELLQKQAGVDIPRLKVVK